MFTHVNIIPGSIELCCKPPTALSIHQLAAQGDVLQVATHISKGKGKDILLYVLNTK